MKFKSRLKRAHQQTRDNPFTLQEASANVSGWYKEVQAILLVCITLAALDDVNREAIFSLLQNNTFTVVFALLFPYALVGLINFGALLARLKETYVPFPSAVADGVFSAPSTKKFADQMNTSNYSVGGAIEVVSHPFLDKRISNNGWHTRSVDIRLKRGFEVPPSLIKSIEMQGDDNRKYCLVGLSRPTTDDFNRLSIDVAPTLFSQIEGARSQTDVDEILRHEMSHLEPEKHRIPNSLCLHASILFDDGCILAMKRRQQTSYFPGAISVSIEEQLAEIDFATPGVEAAESLFRRAICEEVFPLANRYEADPKDTWARVESLVDHFRYWSVTFEENIGNFALVGVCKLRLSKDEYVKEFRKIQEEYHGLRDDEGQFYFMTIGHVRDYLQSGHGIVTPINFTSEDIRPSEAIRDVHPTMPYRCATLLNCL